MYQLHGIVGIKIWKGAVKKALETCKRAVPSQVNLTQSVDRQVHLTMIDVTALDNLTPSRSIGLIYPSSRQPVHSGLKGF